MELSLLDSTFRRSKPIENWNSLMWTERYASNGEFELKSNRIADILSALPVATANQPPTLIAIDQSSVPMVVEDHKIEKPKNGIPTITTTGRSFESVLDRREAIKTVTSGVPRAAWTIDSPSASLAVYTVIKNIIVDGIQNVKDIIPEINLINGYNPSGTSVKYPVEPKDLYTWAIETLALSGTGLKAVLPIPGVSAQITIQTYQGTDRTLTVAFDVALGQLEDGTYLLSNRNYKNVMITATANGMEYSNTGTDPSGLARRVDYQDVSSDVTLPAGTDLTALTVNKGKVALASRLPTTMFSGGVADSVGSGYGSAYFLGDYVTLQGEYGLTQIARVSEFIRTQDNTGIKAYPTFEAAA